MVFSLLLVNCSQVDENIVARINAQVITKAELNYWMLLEKANVYNYFFRTYGAQDSASFWTEKQGNEIPLKKLKEVALEKAKRCKIEQILALEKGIVTTINFDELMHEMTKVNADRKQKVANGEVIYGPKQYTSRTYFSKIQDKMRGALKKELAKNVLYPKKEALDKLKKEDLASGKNILAFLIMQYVDGHYEEYIDKLALRADMQIAQKVYNRMNID